MHVGVEEAVAQRVAQETLDHLASEIGQVDLRLLEPRVVVQRDAVDPLHRQHVVGGAIPVDRRHAKIRIVAGVLRHLGQRGRFQPQIHLHRDRARQRVDDLDQPQPPRFRRIALRPCARQRRNRRGRGGSARRHWAAAPSPRPMCARRRARSRRDAPGRSRPRRPPARSSQTPAPPGVPATPRSRLRPRLCGNGGRRSCRLSRSRAMLTPTTSGRVARNCPSLT